MTWKNRLLVTAVLMGMSGWVASAGEANDREDGWQTTVTPYFWLVGVNAKVRTLANDPNDPLREVDIDFADIFDKLDFGLMGVAEVRKDRFGVLLDFAFANLSVDRSPDTILVRETEIDSDFLLYSLIGAYRVAETPNYALDLTAGFRGIDLETSLATTGGLLGSMQIQDDRSMFDPVIGARMQFDGVFGEQLSLNALGDIGGFDIDSDFTWQIASTLEYHFNEKVSSHLGWRHISYQFEDSAPMPELDISGPVLGVSINF